MKKSRYLSHENISKLDNLYIKAKKVVEGFIVGLHKSPYHGFSVEFSDHKAYGPGDEIRHIDWKLWGKTDRFYVKRYEEETNLKAHILIDQSSSMGYASNDLNKLEYSKILAASLSYMLIKNQDAVGLYMFDSGIKKIIPPHSHKGHLSILLSEMDKIKPNKDDKIDIKKAITTLSKLGKYNFSQGVVVRNKKVIAVEGKSGTEKMLKKCKNKKLKNSGVLVKFPKTKQDSRIDLPTVGLKTLTQCKSAGIKGIVLKSKQNVFLERKKCISFANKNKMFIAVK